LQCPIVGLSIVYGIVQYARGQIAVRSEMGRGTEFEIHIPLARE
jgi:signal transduction histidine kinase